MSRTVLALSNAAIVNQNNDHGIGNKIVLVKTDTIQAIEVAGKTVDLILSNGLRIQSACDTDCFFRSINDNPEMRLFAQSFFLLRSPVNNGLTASRDVIPISEVITTRDVPDG
jgi:hypothetical protein